MEPSASAPETDDEHHPKLLCLECGCDVTSLEGTSDKCSKCGVTLDWWDIRKSKERLASDQIKKTSAWTILSFAGSKVLGQVSSIVLCWLVIPEVFGLMVAVEATLHVMFLVSDLGSRLVIIQSEREDRAFLNTLWTIQVLRGLGLWIAISLLSIPISIFLEQPLLTQLLPVTGFATIMWGLESTKMDLSYRRMAIAKVRLIELTAQFVAVIAMIVIAWVLSSRGVRPEVLVWALVAGHLVDAFVTMSLGHLVLSGFPNRFHWDSSAARELFTFGRWVVISTALTALADKSDRFVLGKLLNGTTVLGIYGRAVNLIFMPITAISELSQSVLFPLLSQEARGNRQDFLRTFNNARGLVILASRVCILCLVFLIPAYFLLLYKPEWWDAIWMTKILCVALWFSLLQAASDRALLAVGDSRALMLTNLCKLVMSVLACTVGYLWFGLTGFLLGLAIGTFSGYLVVSWFLAKSQQIYIFSQDVLATAVLMVLVGIGLGLIQFIFPMWNLSVLVDFLMNSRASIENYFGAIVGLFGGSFKGFPLMEEKARLTVVHSLLASLFVLPIPVLLMGRKLLQVIRSKRD